MIEYVAAQLSSARLFVNFFLTSKGIRTTLPFVFKEITNLMDALGICLFPCELLIFLILHVTWLRVSEAYTFLLIM